MEKSMAEKIKSALTLDGWSNVLTSIGIKGRDKRLSSTVKWERKTRQWLEEFYSADDIASNIVDVVPEEALSKGFKLKGVDDKNKEEAILGRLAELRFTERFLEAAILSRLHGGSGIVKITEDAKLDLPMPINKKLLSLSVVDRWDLIVNSTDINSEITSPNFRDPKSYNLQISEGSSSQFLVLNAERLVRFDGAYLPRQVKRNNHYWGDSVLNKLENAIRNYQISHDAAAMTIQDFSIPVLKMKNLAELMTSNCDDKVIKRLEMVNLAKSVARMIVLDADKESFEHVTRNVTGMKDVLDKIEGRLIAAAKMPRTKMFGESAGGLGSSGESQSSNWYDYIETYQSNYLKPKMLDIIHYMLISEFGYTKETAKKIDVEFSPLWQMSEKEEADMRKIVAETDVMYLDRQVVDSTEIALSRFGGDKYSSDTKIDKEMRENESGEVISPVELEEDTESEEVLKSLAQEITDGGPGSGPQGGNGSSTKESENLSKSMAREKAATEKLQSFNAGNSWDTPEYQAAAKEYKSAVRERQKSVREAKAKQTELRAKISALSSNKDTEEIHKKLDEIKKLAIQDMKKPHIPCDYILKKDQSFEMDVEIKGKDGQKMDLAGYSFATEITKDGKIIDHYAISKVEGKQGVVGLKFEKDTVFNMQDSGGDGVFAATVIMTRPNGTKKVIREYKVRVDE